MQPGAALTNLELRLRLETLQARLADVNRGHPRPAIGRLQFGRGFSALRDMALTNSVSERRDQTMQRVKWLSTVFVSPVAALVFSVAICGALIVSLTAELHQQLWTRER